MGTILKNAANEIDIKSAWLDANIEAANLQIEGFKLTSTLQCAREILSALQEAESGNVWDDGIDGVIQCGTALLSKVIFKRIKKYDKLNKISEALRNNSQIKNEVTAKLKDLIPPDYVEEFIISLIQNAAKPDFSENTHKNE